MRLAHCDSRMLYKTKRRCFASCQMQEEKGELLGCWTQVVQTNFKCKCNIHGKVIIVLVFHIIVENNVQYLFLNNIYGTKENYLQLSIQCLYFLLVYIYLNNYCHSVILPNLSNEKRTNLMFGKRNI